MQTKPLTLTIKSRDGIVFGGQVKSVTSTNDKGRFDILPKHANFISLVKDFLEYVDSSDKRVTIKFRDAVLRAGEDKVDVYMGI